MVTLETLGLEDKITFHAKPLQLDYLYLILSRAIPENKEYLQVFNLGLGNLKESGQLEALIDQSLPNLPLSYLVADDKEAHSED
ncbi:MAG: hypothetical protein R3296_12045 [Oleiphilaceae bacterium]|nr:hypothetical protein [Oleiphilaceae bacterium]